MSINCFQTDKIELWDVFCQFFIELCFLEFHLVSKIINIFFFNIASKSSSKVLKPVTGSTWGCVCAFTKYFEEEIYSNIFKSYFLMLHLGWGFVCCIELPCLEWFILLLLLLLLFSISYYTRLLECLINCVWKDLIAI